MRCHAAAKCIKAVTPLEAAYDSIGAEGIGKPNQRVGNKGIVVVGPGKASQGVLAVSIEPRRNK